MSNEQYGVWVHWFAWHPVSINGNRFWLTTIERKRVPFGWYLRPLPEPIQEDRKRR